MVDLAMHQDERKTLAAQRARRYAPKRTGGAVMTGVCGTVVALHVDVAASGFYGWRVIEHAWLPAAAMAAGFMLVTLGYQRAKRLNRTARHDELTQINAVLSVQRELVSSSAHQPLPRAWSSSRGSSTQPRRLSVVPCRCPG
jgi:hypothetical protein